MLFELLTGKVPFEGDTVGAMFYAITTTDAARLVDVRPDLPEALSRVVERCLKRNPAERYADARELAAELAAALDQKPRPRFSAPPSGDANTLVGIIGQGPALNSRFASKQSGIEASGVPSVGIQTPRSDPQLPSSQRGGTLPESGAVRAVPVSRASGSMPQSSGTLPSSPRGASVGPFRPATRSRAEAQRRTRDTPAMRRAAPPPRQLAWTDILAVLGVGVVLAIAILLAFRMAR
jgi:serine/threonine-protein kinase